MYMYGGKNYVVRLLVYNRAMMQLHKCVLMWSIQLCVPVYCQVTDYNSIICASAQVKYTYLSVCGQRTLCKLFV